jgi:hypothetical protein
MRRLVQIDSPERLMRALLLQAFYSIRYHISACRLGSPEYSVVLFSAIRSRSEPRCHPTTPPRTHRERDA